MSDGFKYAILDTDFVSKANIIKADNRVLADEVLEFPGYKFYCHQKMKEELGDHGTRPSKMWLDDKIKTGAIRLYTDEQIIDELREETGDNCYAYYVYSLIIPKIAQSSGFLGIGACVVVTMNFSLMLIFLKCS